MEHEDSAALAAIFQDELFSAAAYRQLAHWIPEHSGALHQLSNQNRAGAACIRGICNLRSITAPACPAYENSRLPVHDLLRKCCSRELKCFTGYENHRTDPEFGCVFARLAARKAEHILKMLEIAGSIER